MDGFDLTSVRGCTSGGAPLATSVIEEVYKRLNILIKVGYGLSETGGATQQQSMTWESLKKEMGSCGGAYPATEIKIRSTNDGKSESSSPSSVELTQLRDLRSRRRRSQRSTSKKKERFSLGEEKSIALFSLNVC